MATIEAIQTTYLESDTAEASTVVWDDIPSTFKHLEIRFAAKGSRNDSAHNDDVLMRLGNEHGGSHGTDTGTNYAYHYIYQHGTTKTSYALASQTSIYIPRISSIKAGNSNFSQCVMTIMDYANTSKATTVYGYSAMLYSGSTTQSTAHTEILTRFGSGSWHNATNNRVNTIWMQPVDGGHWQRGSSFTLYGIGE